MKMTSVAIIATGALVFAYFGLLYDVTRPPEGKFLGYDRRGNGHWEGLVGGEPRIPDEFRMHHQTLGVVIGSVLCITGAVMMGRRSSEK